MYLLIAGKPPFDDGDPAPSFDESALDSPAWTRVSDEGKSLVTKLLDQDPASRMTASQLSSSSWVLSHEKDIRKLNRGGPDSGIDVADISTSLVDMKEYTAKRRLKR